MSNGAKITNILNGTIDAVKSIIPTTLTIAKPSLTLQPFQLLSIGVLIGMTGDIRGRIAIAGEEQTLSNISEIMFGMRLEGEMLHSFTGEFGNMLAGHISMNIAAKGLTTDITTPTIMMGQSKIYGFDRALLVPITISDKGEIQITLMIETEKK